MTAKPVAYEVTFRPPGGVEEAVYVHAMDDDDAVAQALKLPGNSREHMTGVRPVGPPG